MLIRVPFAFVALAFATALFAAPQTPPESEEPEISDEQMDAHTAALIDSLEGSYTYQHGVIQVGGDVATLNVPDGFKFLDAEQSKQVVVDVWDNPPDVAESVLGMIIPTYSGVLDNPFAFVVEYDDMGYVSDEDADDIDYDEMMTGLKKDDAEENKHRQEAGYGTLELVGWASQPYYDKEHKVLHWAKELHAEDADGNTLNYNVRVLGRKGVLILNAVAGMTELDSVKENIPAVLSMAKFNPGYTYEEFDSSIDDVAAWTIGGLVAGKVLAKVGLFALLLKNIKLIILAIGGGGVAAWRFFTGRKKKDGPEDYPKA